MQYAQTTITKADGSTLHGKPRNFNLQTRRHSEYKACKALGVQKTAGIITSAALLFVTVVGLFATSKVSLLERIGLGLACAVIIDATLVRMVLIPATMELLGKANWWAPKPLRWIYQKFGLTEG